MPFGVDYFFAKEQVKHIEKVKTAKPPKGVLGKDIENIRKLIISTAGKIELNLNSFLMTSPNPLRYKNLYSYYLLVNARQVSIDYFPTSFNAKYIPILNNVIERVKEKAEEDYYLLPNVDDIILKYINRVSCNFCNLSKNERGVYLNFESVSAKFEKGIEADLKKMQELEIRYFAKELTPQNPKDKEVAYLVKSIKLKPNLKTILSKAVAVLLQYLQKGKVKVGLLEEYKFYIEKLQDSSNAF